MPTIILLETSLSLQKQISESENLVDVFQRNVLYFLTEMEEQHPLEMTSLITFSSNARVLCPFTRYECTSNERFFFYNFRDFKSLKSSLYNIKLEEGNNFQNALETMKKYASENMHNFADVVLKIIVLTTYKNAEKWKGIYLFPFPCLFLLNNIRNKFLLWAFISHQYHSGGRE